jgi:hypothetical protein
VVQAVLVALVALKELQVILVVQAVLVAQVAHKELQVILVVLLVQAVVLDCQVFLEYKALKDQVVLVDLVAHREYKVIQAI